MFRLLKVVLLIKDNRNPLFFVPSFRFLEISRFTKVVFEYKKSDMIANPVEEIKQALTDKLVMEVLFCNKDLM